MALDALRALLQTQADTGKQVLISQASVQAAGLTPRAGFDQIVQSRLLVTGELAIGFSGTVSQPAPGTVTLSAPGQEQLGATGVTIDVVFTEQGDGTVDALVALRLPDSWRLGAAFAALVGEPFAELTLGSTRYVVTTAPAGSYDWRSQPHPITQGAWLFSMLTLNGPLAVITALLKGASTADQAQLIGAVDPSQMKDPGWFPLLELTAIIGHALDVPHFELSSPRIELHTVSDAGTGRPFGWLLFATTLSIDGQPLCDFKASVSSGLTAVTFGMYPVKDPAAQITLPRIITLLGGPDFSTSIPPELSSVFAAVGLKGLSATIGLSPPRLLSASAAIGSTGTWRYGQVQVEDTTLQVTELNPLQRGPVMLSFEARARLFPDTALDVLFDLGISYDVGTGDLAVVAGIEHPISLGDALSALSGGAVAPPADWSLSLSQFGVSLDKPSDGKVQYQLFAAASAGFTLPMLGAHVDSDLQLLVDSREQRFRLTGGLSVGGSRFTAEIDLAAASKVISGGWQALGEDYLELSPLLSDLGLGQVEIPKGLDLNLKSAQLRYDITNSILVIEAESAVYGKAVFAALKSTSWVFFFGLDIDRRIGLSDLPLIGKDLDAIVSVAVDDITVLVSSGLDATAATAINDQICKLAPGYPHVPSGGMKAVALSMSFDAGGEKTTLLIAAPPDPQRAAGRGMLAAAAAADPTPSDGTIWINLQKTFGPLSFQKVGIRYRSSTLYFLMNASISGGGLSVAVMGLGVGSPLSSFQPKFTIDGIAITFASGPVEISGALVGSIDPVNFYGELILGIGALQISAIGGYAEVEHHPSLFLYAVLDYPIGGPEFFFVTGLAAGFGYNRKLLIPPVDGVATFPFVQWAVGTGDPPPTDPTSLPDTVTKVVAQLSSGGVVAPSLGDDWVALGVKFTSFDLVDSFALVTIVFGTRFEIALLGMSTLQLPPAPEPAVARAQLALEATFSPDTGLLAISGQLTPDSFLLSRDCRLTGGFAFWAWFGGDHEGEFVVTLGGYSPRFGKPDYYPAVPRLGLNWQVTPELTISGDLYFALTSSAVMAGGGMRAVWQSGDICAWFQIEADFLLVFQPFHYYLSAGIQLGASFTLSLLFTSITISIHLGVGIEIWGPDFTGRATVDLSIVSFTIGFGSGEKNADTTIKWPDFLDKLMPGEHTRQLAPTPHSVRAFGLAAPPPPPDPPIVQITPSAGLLKRLSDKEGELNWVVSGTALRLVTQSAIPTKDWKFLTGNVRLAQNAPTPTTDFGVGPTGTSVKDFTSTQTIEIAADEPGSLFLATPLQRNVSTALWQPRTFDGNGVPVNLDPLNDTTIAGVAVGFTLDPFVPEPDHTLPIPLENIEYTIIEPPVPVRWSDASVPQTDDFAPQEVWQTIGAAQPSAIRAALATACAGDGFAVPTDIDVSELATEGAYDLLASPTLRLLGEQR
jgi:hypothetical protein